MMKSRQGTFVACLDRGDTGTPLFVRLYSAVRQAILDEQLRAGERLPSARTLATDLGLSRTTVEEAYSQLWAEGFVDRRTGSGTFVSKLESVQRPRAQRQRAHSRASRRLSTRAKSLARHACFPEAKRPRAFAAASPAVDAFPIQIWRSLVSRNLRRADQATLGSCDPAGYQPLRTAIASYLSVARGVICTAERVVILTSSQQGLDLAARLLVDAGEEVWMEEPGYPGAMAAFLANGARPVPVPVDAEGMRIADGRRKAPKARLAYVTPSHQYPLGVTMSIERRLQLLQWAAATGSWVVEDDYDSEFRYVGRPIAALQGIDQDQRVIYIGTFSKVLFPAIRLAYAVLPEDLVDTFVVARGLSDGHPPATTQAALTDFFNHGHFGAHIRRMREIYRQRRDALLLAAERHLRGAILESTDAGLHAILRLPAGADDVSISQALERVGVDAQPLSRFHIASPQNPGLFLGYAALSPDEIVAGVKSMAEHFDR